MRKLHEVIENIIQEIPEDQDELICEIKNIYESVIYCAPESMRLWWLRTAECLQSALGEDPNFFEEEWKIVVYNIFMDKN